MESKQNDNEVNNSTQEPIKGTSQSLDSGKNDPGQSPTAPSGIEPKIEKSNSDLKLPQNNKDQKTKPDSQQDVKTVTVDSIKSGKFPLMLIVLGLLAVAGLAFAGYAFYSNQQAKRQAEDNQQPSETVTSEVTIKNGNIVRLTSSGEESILINKEDFETTGITGFAKMETSPDGQKICFETIPPAPIPAIYVSDSNGGNLIEVGRSRINCHWLAEGSAIVYTNSTSDTAPVDIYKYDLTDSSETLLTNSTPEGVIRYFDIKGIDNDGVTIQCSFREAAGTTVQPSSERNCTLDSSTGELNVLNEQT